jgi:putative addiction module component (TIGR02574 family)
MGAEATEMDTRFDQIVADVMKLPLRDRVKLAQRLVFSLDDQVETGVEALWAAEAERRLEELRTGRVQGIDAMEAFRKARKALER